ncbi:MAG: FAD-binding oxidoreductase [Candidatus Omnitrophica bacterium]|nr:FAD-binding oxidoreductase [Candidatus Omnitrophota bacterium]
MEAGLIKKLQGIAGIQNVIFENEKLQDYSHDEFPLPAIKNLPLLAVKPRTADDISQILKLANKEKIPVTPRGGGTGLCGGCVPAKGGIVILFDNLNKVLEVDNRNFMVTSEAGVMLKDLYVVIEKEGLFFPPHPGDETATVGGVIATNAGGSRAVKHGTIRNFTRGLEVVLPGGGIIKIGGKFIKNSSGLNLLNLFIGSEGTLGVITKAIIGLLPMPKETGCLVVSYEKIADAIKTAPEIVKSDCIPLAVEFIELDAIELTERYLGRAWPVKGGGAYLMILLDAADKEGINHSSEIIAEICLKNGARDVFVADNKARQKEILDFRSQMYTAMKPNCIETLDIAVPLSEIAGHVEAVHRIEKEHGLWLPTYGHAGDGNVHTHIMKFGFKEGRPVFSEQKGWEAIYPVVRDLLHEDARKRGGIVSGEHGIGLVKKGYLGEFLGDTQVEIMKKIKAVFDPNGILNPGKIF